MKFRSSILLRGLQAGSFSVSMLCIASPSLLLAQEAEDGPTTTLTTIVVDGNGMQTPGTGATSTIKTDRYVAKSATVGTKTDTDLAKVPQSISVISRKELEDRQVQSLVQATSYSAGVRTGVYGFDPRADTVFIRGFNVTTSGYFRDGLRDFGGSFSLARKEPYGLEGISILKGPSSVLYGAGSPAGIVNVISKRPTEEPFNEIEAQIGNFSRAQVNIDSSGPVAGNDNILYRFTGLLRDADTQFIAAANDRAYIAPALTLRSEDRNTQLTILGEYARSKTGGSAGFVSENGNITNRESGDPAYKDFVLKQARIGYEFEHRFSDDLTFRQNLRYAEVDADMRYVSEYGKSADGLYALRRAYKVLDNSKTFVIDNHLEWKVDTGPVHHTVLAGLDYSYLDNTYGVGFVSAPNLSLSNPNYGAQPITGPTVMNSAQTATKQSMLGVYLQDQIEYDRFVLTIGGRHDWLDTKLDNILKPANSQDTDVSHFSGRVGLSYLFDNGISPYASYSTSFAPNSGRSYTGEYFEPSEGEQIELGIKYAPTDINLAINAALFNIEQTNTLASDPDHIGFSVTRGKVRSRGFEIEAKTSLADGIDLTAAYTYLDPEILEGDNPGKVPSGIPTNQVTMWANYEVQSGALEGLNVGAGARFYGKTWKTDTNTTGKNASRVLVDASIGYDFGYMKPELKGLTAQLNVKNIFDNRETTCAGSWCYVEEGRTVIGSLRYRF